MSTSQRFEHSFHALGSEYVTPTAATPVSAPKWLAWNHRLAKQLGWPEAWGQNKNTLGTLAGNAQFEGSKPGATAYAGHQFGSYNPQLGDGRAMLLGEWRGPDGKLVDIQLKGAGPTPYSRGGDGRSPVGPVVREYLMSEAMHALGVPTTRALAAVATGDSVYRQQPEPGAILTRVATSHIRIGTIQFFAMTRQGKGLEELVNYVTERHYLAALQEAKRLDPTVTHAQVLLNEVIRALANLTAHWQSLGFIHGVLNTDNMLLCGETVDYGPCAFMDVFAAGQVFSSIDTGGRYAFGNQPGIVHWNISVLAQCLLPLIDQDQEKALVLAQASVDQFPTLFTDIYSARLAAKFGLDAMRDTDRTLIETFFSQLEEDKLDFTLAFRWLTEIANDNLENTMLEDLFTPSSGILNWLTQWSSRRNQTTPSSSERMKSANPVVIPRNHWVAQAINSAEAGDSELMDTLHSRWQAPFSWQAGDEQFAATPKSEEQVHRTFCGT